jgi:hypothetical protein
MNFLLHRRGKKLLRVFSEWYLALLIQSKPKSAGKGKKADAKKSSTNLGTESGQAALNPEDFQKLKDELELERQERNYFQLERVNLALTFRTKSTISGKSQKTNWPREMQSYLIRIESSKN